MSSDGGQTDERPLARVRRRLLAASRNGFILTAEEQRAVWVVLSLFLLGLTVRVWHMSVKPHGPAHPPAVGQTRP